MQDHIRIRNLPQHIGESVTLRGWIMTTRFSGKIGFLVLRDGTGYLQMVISRAEAGDELWERVRSLTQETSVSATGTVREDTRSPGGVELALASLDIVGASVDFPITPKE